MYKKYKINQNAFDDINTPDKAYLLGFICADGCNYKNKALVINIHEKDISVLYLLKNVLETDIPIKKLKNKNMVSFRVWNIKLMQSLQKYNINQRKTYTIKMPEILNHLHKHFWRGVIDGDGCLYYKQRSSKIPIFTVTLVGSSFLMKDFSEYIKSLNFNYEPKINTMKSIFSVVLCSKNAYNFCKVIYDENYFSLTRKKNIFDQIKIKKRELPKGMRFVGKNKKIKVFSLSSLGVEKDKHIGVYNNIDEAIINTKIYYEKKGINYTPDYGNWD